jgi:hypothetical protein
LEGPPDKTGGPTFGFRSPTAGLIELAQNLSDLIQGHAMKLRGGGLAYGFVWKMGDLKIQSFRLLRDILGYLIFPY